MDGSVAGLLLAAVADEAADHDHGGNAQQAHDDAKGEDEPLARAVLTWGRL